MMSDAFTARVERLMARLQPVPAVTPEAYRAITCNRCGLCCEDIPAPCGPDELAALAAVPSLTEDTRRFLAGLEPVEPTATGWRYRCRHFARAADGLGVCGIFETRPEVCRRFPYGGVVRRWSECAWFVQIQAPDGTVLPMMPDADRSRLVPSGGDGSHLMVGPLDGPIAMEEQR